MAIPDHKPTMAVGKLSSMYTVDSVFEALPTAEYDKKYILLSLRSVQIYFNLLHKGIFI